MELQLLFHNIGFISGSIVALIFALFVYLKDHKAVPNRMFGLAFLSIAVFCTSHVIGVNITDPILSRNVLMLNISVIWIACFLTHCSFAMIGALEKQKSFLQWMYVIATLVSLFYIAFPDTYLLPSVPKMYFTNYYVAGSLQWVMRILFSIGLPTYFLGYLFYAYQHMDMTMRNRLRYFFVALIIGYTVGSLAIPLVYDIPIDPIFASPFVLILAIPMSYALLRYNLMDIRLVAQRALIFSVIIACTSFAIFIIGYLNFVLLRTFPNFPLWILPLLAGVIATGIGIIVWHKFRESDHLKYEFITIVTHKLRTPLTAIKWSAENLVDIVPSEGKSDLEHIKSSTEKLVEIVNTLVHVSSEDQEQYSYRYTSVDIADVYRQILREFKDQATRKKVILTDEGSPEAAYIHADISKIRLCLQTLIDNALTYTPGGGTISTHLTLNKTEITISIRDTGIGLDRDEALHIFSRLYRTDSARLASTEGMGVGLFVAKKIVERHDGRLKVHSDGPGKGSVFTVSLPASLT